MTNPTKAAEVLKIYNDGYEGDPDFLEFVGGATIREALQLLDAKQRGDEGWLPIESIPERTRVLVSNGLNVDFGYKYQGKIAGNPTHWRYLPSAPKEKI